MLNAQIKTASDSALALTALGTSMFTFQEVLSSMSSKKSVLANTAAFSSDVGTAVASYTATAGTYQFYVQQLAIASQVSYAGVQNDTQQPLQAT